VEYKSGWSRKRVLLLVLVGFDTYSTILCSYLISASMLARLSLYIKDNDRKYGVIVTFCDPKTSKVIGMQCCLCIAFSWEEKVGSKCKATTKVQGWSAPFRYNNIKNRMRTQH